MSKIRNDKSTVQARETRPTSSARQPLAFSITEDAVARSILDAAKQAEADKGAVTKADFEDMLKRAMSSKPGEMNPAAAQAVTYVIERHRLSADAKPLADIIQHADSCRHKGHLSEKDLESMMRRAWDGERGQVDDGAATALRFVGWRDTDIMDAGARALMTDFVSAWYHDRVESPAVQEARRQAAEQLAQDKQDFRDFMKTDKAEHQKLSYGEFKDKLQHDRVDASEWQTLMLWLQTGVKKKPITS